MSGGKPSRRDQILDAAERIFATKGYTQAGIADIAAALGIGHGTFYRYFRNKQHIAASVLDRVIERLAAVGLAEDPESAQTLDEYRAQTERILGRMLALVGSEPSVVKLVLDTYATFTERFLRNGVLRGFLRSDLDIGATAQVLVALIFEGMRRVLSTDMDRRAQERWVAAGVALMFDGVRKR